MFDYGTTVQDTQRFVTIEYLSEKYARAEQFNGLAPIDAKNNRIGSFSPNKPEANFEDKYTQFMEESSPKNVKQKKTQPQVYVQS